jgi:molecular chaperone GrpE (heat shock protein)
MTNKTQLILALFVYFGFCLFLQAQDVQNELPSETKSKLDTLETNPSGEAVSAGAKSSDAKETFPEGNATDGEDATLPVESESSDINRTTSLSSSKTSDVNASLEDNASDSQVVPTDEDKKESFSEENATDVEDATLPVESESSDINRTTSLSSSKTSDVNASLEDNASDSQADSSNAKKASMKRKEVASEVPAADNGSSPLFWIIPAALLVILFLFIKLCKKRKMLEFQGNGPHTESAAGKESDTEPKPRLKGETESANESVEDDRETVPDDEEGKEPDVVQDPPEEVSSGISLEALVQGFHQMKQCQVDDSEKLQSQLGELMESFATLRKALDEKDAEIRRLRKGIDEEIYRGTLKKFIKVDADFAKDIGALPDEDSTARKILEDLREIFQEAFYESGLECFSPEKGESVRTAFGIDDSYVTIPTETEEQHLTIAEIVESGYLLDTPDGPKCVKPAKVKVFIINKEN